MLKGVCVLSFNVSFILPQFYQRKKVEKAIGFDPTDYMKSGKSGLKNPPGTQWHHPEDPLDEVWLVKTCDHRRHHKKQKCGGISIGKGK